MVIAKIVLLIWYVKLVIQLQEPTIVSVKIQSIGMMKTMVG